MTEKNRAISKAIERLDEAIHVLAQPLTALSFTVEMGSQNPSADAWKLALEQSRVEIRRAIAALEEVRAASHLLSASTASEKEYGSLPWKHQE